MVTTTHWLRKFFARTLWQHCKRGFVVLSLAILLVPLFSYTRVLPHTGNGHATALTNSTLNFQARLQTSAGAIAPDGYYHVEFKLYDALTGGTLLWTETRTTGNLVRVAHGYLTVDLGSVTTFPSTIPWDQQLYLTMNIGGTAGTATWDGEMSPRLKLTAVPYAFNAKTASQLATSNGGFLSTLSIANPTGGNQTFQIQDQGAAGTYNLLTENQINAGYIQNQGVGVQTTSQFWISDAGRSDTSFLAPLFDTPDASALNIGTTNATSISLNQSTTIAANKNITFAAGTGSFDQSSSTGSFSTGSGVVLLNGNTTVATGKNLTVTNGTTSLTGTTNINTTGAATTTIGNSGATNAIAGTTTVTGTTNVNTTGTAATTIGSATGGAVNISANAASSFTTATGALTLTSAAAATWGTNAGALTLQGFGGTTVTSAAGTSSSAVTITSGNASAGASGNITIDTGTASTTAGTVSIGTTNASAVTIGRVGTTTTIQGTTAVTPQASTSTTLLCSNSGVISTCDASVVSPTAANFIQNQATTPGTAQTGNFNINGTGIADTLQGTTKVLTATLDAVTAATALNLGTTNASVINLNQSTTLAANKNITFAAGAGNFDQSASTGTFATGTGAVSLNGDTTVATGKNLTVTNGTTSLTGTITATGATNINTTGAAATNIGTGTGNITMGNTTGTLGLTGSTVTVLGATNINTTGTAITTIGNAGATNAIAGTTTMTGITNINTTGTAATTIGSATGGVVAITANAASSFTTVTGNLTLDAGAALQLGTTNATSLLLGKTTTTATVQGSLTMGAAAGTGTFTNNGATINTEKTYGNFATGGAIDTAANSVDRYTYFSIAQTTAAQTITLPTPTSNPTTVFGRTIYVSNIGTTSFTIAGSLILPGNTATFIWSNTDRAATGGESWQYSGDGGGSANYIQNQNSAAQTANLWVNGTARADTKVLTPTLDTATAAALDIGTTGTPTTTQINLNQNTVLASGKSLTVNGVQLVKSPVGQDSTTAFQIQNSLNTPVLTASTAGGSVLTLGSGTAGGVVGWVGRVAAGAYYSAGAGANSQALTLTKAVPAGHTLIGSLNLNSLASLPVLTVSDSKGNTYQVDGSLDDATTNTTYLFSARITNALSVGDVITLGLPTSPTVNTRNRWAWDIEEFDNIVASSWLDQTSSNAASSINPTTGTSPSTTQSNELVFAAFGYGSRTFTPSTGSLFTVSPQQKTTAGSSDRSLSNEWKFVTATGTQVATGKFSAPASAAAYVGLLATYKTTGALSAVTGTLSLADGAGFAGTFVAPLLSDNRTYLLPDESGMLCLQGSANCGFILTNSDAITIGTPTNPTVVQKVAQTTNNTAGADLTVQGATGNGTGTGGTVTIKGGTGGATNANGGTLVLSGGDAGGTGKMGLVSLNPTVFAASGVQTLGTTQTLTQSWIDSYSTLPLVASAPSLTFTVPAPSINTVGRVFYLSNAGVSGTGNDFSISLAGTGISINLKPNSTATLIWNGNGWTAAGASSATDLQAAYNNTQTSAGGAEIVLNPIGGAADGLTIRNNGTTPIVGGLFEVQSNIGTNLFSVNNQGAELAANGGAETITNFGTNWTALGGTTITQSNTTYATGKYSVDVTQPAGGAANRGVINNLSANPAVSTTYTVSFTAKVSSGTPTLNVYYSYNGGGTQTPCTMYGSYQTANTTQWSKVTCRITTPANAVTNPDLVIYTSDAIGATRELYIDNLSFVQNDANTIPSNVQMGGGVNGGQVTLFTLDRSSVPPLVANGDSRYLGSMYYDTTLGNIQCYELDGWGACGSAPDNIITLTPEYTGAVLNGTGVGTMTADFCGNGGGLTVNTGFCASGEARNYYRWTSPQATDQAYSIYVSYKLPSTFKEFVAGTTSLTSLVDNTSNASVKYAIFKKNSAGGLVSCSADATMTGTVSTWNSTVPTVDLGTGACHTGGATPFAAGDTVVIRITVSAKSNANAYVENLTFRYSNK